MKRRFFMFFSLLAGLSLINCGTAPAQTNPSVADNLDLSNATSYFVEANGNDANPGISKEAPFRTLSKAVDAAKKTHLKTITVIGTLIGSTEIIDTGSSEILITGGENRPENEKAALNPVKPVSADTTELETGITISGNSVIRLEHITVTGGFTQGIYVEGEQARLTLGKGTVISGNGGKAGLDMRIEIGGGILVSDGATLIMRDNAVISGNYAGNGGGVCILDGHLKMYDNAVIRDNVAKNDSFRLGGGGIACVRGGIELRDNSTITGNSGVYAGGIFMQMSAPIQTEDGPVGESSGVYESRHVFGNTATESFSDWEVGHNIYVMNK